MSLKIDYGKRIPMHVIIVILYNKNEIIFRERKFILNSELTNTLGNFHNARYTTQQSGNSHIQWRLLWDRV